MHACTHKIADLLHMRTSTKSACYIYSWCASAAQRIQRLCILMQRHLQLTIACKQCSQRLILWRVPVVTVAAISMPVMCAIVLPFIDDTVIIVQLL
jgi:hypothetical protein